MENFLPRIRNSDDFKTEEINLILDSVMKIFYLEPPLLNLSTPIAIVGDIHGQFEDLLNIFERMTYPPYTTYLFLGDVVDRGDRSLDCILYLFVLKILYPEKVFMIRGNHETRDTSGIYGFQDEMVRKYGDTNLYKNFHRVFDFLPAAAVVDGRFFCVHGGLSAKCLTLAQINSKSSDIVSDFVWSDPCGNGFGRSTRGLGMLFGEDVTSIFLRVNNLKAVIRAHQLVNEGFKYDFADRMVVTVWSVPNYCRRYNNQGAVLRLERDHVIDDSRFEMFEPKFFYTNLN